MSSLIVAAVDTHHSFRVSLQQATRLEVDDSRNNNNDNNNNDNDYNDDDDNRDWSVHTVDYEAFKNKLRQFGKRRSVVRRKLRTSTLGITASELDALLGPPPAAVTRADVQAMMLPTNSFYFLQQLQQQQLQQQQQQQQQWGQKGGHGGSQLFGSHPMGGRIRSDTELRLPHKMMDLSDTQIMSNQRRSGLRRPPVTLLIPEDADPIQEEQEETTTAYVTMSDDVVDDSDDWSKSAHSSIQYIDTAATPVPSSAVPTTTLRTMPFIPRLFGTNRPLKRRSIMRQLSNWERNDIVSFLSMELDKAAMFYLSQWQRLSQQYMVLTQGGYNAPAAAVEEVEKDAISTDDDDEIEMNRTFDYVPPNNNNNSKKNNNDDDASDGTDADSAKYEPWIRLGKEILELHAFCVINIVAVRQILIRYDAFARAFEGTPMMQYYMKTIKSDRGATSFRKILQHEEVLALGESYLKQLSMMQQQQQQRQRQHQQHSSKKNHKNAYSMIAKQFVTEQAKLQAVVASSENAEATSSTGHAPLHDTLLQSLRYYFVLGMLEDRLGFEPSYLHSRGRSLTREMKQLAEWRRHSLEPWPTDGKALAQKTTTFIGCCQLPFGEVDSEDMHEIKEEPSSHDDQNQDVSPPEPVVSRQQRFNLTMALIAGFFYCMNYYIVEPSSTMYVNALGASDAMSATLIGMMPIASFLSAIAYSIWTNSSFRKPFMVSCFLMLSGNIIYSAAFNFRSLPMALAGRFMTGLGGPKCIIRRYLADTTSLNIRTSVNALFGMVVAAGSALGPGCAILLNKLDFSLELPFGSNADVVVNGMTGPGWFMATLWTLFSVLLWFGFREQDRIGLAEQMQKEEGGDEEDDNQPISNDSRHNPTDDDLMTLMSGKSSQSFDNSQYTNMDVEEDSLWKELKRVSTLVTFPVRICLGLLFAKVFVIETLVSCTSSLSKNRYGWKIQQVGLLGLANGMCVIPLSIMVGKASMMYQDRFLMICLLSVGVLGMSLLIDYYDLFSNENNGHPMHHSVGPGQYVAGYFITYMSIQSFEGIIGSALSKVIPTALATGTFNSGLLATLTDTFGRSCGDLFISLMGTINIDQLMNLLFLPGVLILFTCLFMVRKYYDLLAV
ncbi:putative sugar transporter [Nitzschia inconspicua]|uniref:Sugar transporter n=1 Tax=Nitzschia inconspicua TaxID=303405 RepID=A0A9K3KL21_9STRA|nr:putative sugar transporter [Nitzschia inconspicua]